MKIINHVMSQDIHSNILNSFIDYLKKSDPLDVHITSIEPIENADVYHYHRPHLEKKLMKSSVVTVHHDLEENDPWLSLSKFLGVYKDAEAVVCLNHTQKKILSDYQINHTHVVPHGYNTKVFSDIQKKTEKKQKLTLGLISKRYGRRVKGEAYFLDLIKRLDQDLFDFILVGDGRSQEYYLLKEYGFDVRVYERLPYRLFSSLYANIDILLMLSSFEGGPANVPEALISKVPVAGFPIGMIPDFIEDNVNGLLLTGNVDDDAHRLMAFAEKPEQFVRLQKSTNKANKKVPTWENVADMYNDVYISVVGK